MNASDDTIERKQKCNTPDKLFFTSELTALMHIDGYLQRKNVGFIKPRKPGVGSIMREGCKFRWKPYLCQCGYWHLTTHF